VLSNDRFEGAKVHRFARLDVFLQQIALGRAGIRAGGPCRLVRRQTLAEPSPRTLQCAVYGSEQFGHLRCVVTHANLQPAYANNTFEA
jgi:hypothetical protein